MRSNRHLDTNSANLRQYATTSQDSFARIARACASGFRFIDLRKANLCGSVQDAKRTWALTAIAESRQSLRARQSTS